MEQPKKNFKIVTSKKTRVILPNIFTLVGVCIGLSSIKFALDGRFEISILNERVTMFTTPSATKHIFLDPEDNFSSKRGWEFSIGPTF